MVRTPPLRCCAPTKHRGQILYKISNNLKGFETGVGEGVPLEINEGH